jgi:hypothetical protein
MTIRGNVTHDQILAAAPDGFDVLPSRSGSGYLLRSREARFVPSYFGSNRYSDRRTHVATYEEHGEFMARVFDADPNAVIKTTFATYRGRTDFDQQTNYEF